MGDQIEELLFRFRALRIEPHSIEHVRRSLHRLNETERRLVLVELADHLEKHVDLGVLYFGDNDWVMSADELIGRELIEIADELGEPRLSEMLSRAFGKRRLTPQMSRRRFGHPMAGGTSSSSCVALVSVDFPSGCERVRSKRAFAFGHGHACADC
jgi:hypothetical protein